MDYGLKVSIDGQDVKTATDHQLTLTTKFPFLKAYIQGSTSISITANGNYSVEITHNLGYIPVFVHYGIVNPNDPGERYLGVFAADAPMGGIELASIIDDTKLTLGWKDTTNGYFKAYPYTVYFYYYIFYDDLE